MKYVSILRGINVSGKNKILMADLKTLYETLGFQNVITYIQSGNVIFDSKLKSKADIKAKIEKKIEEKYQFQVPVELRTSSDFEKIVNICPFGSVDLAKDGTKILVTFLSSQPTKANVSKILEYVVPPEKMVIRDKEVYLHCPNGYGKSKLSNAFIENKLGITATTRNWKSVCKLHELSVD